MRLRKESEFHQFGYAITDGEGLERGCCPKPFKQKCHCWRGIVLGTFKRIEWRAAMNVLIKRRGGREAKGGGGTPKPPEHLTPKTRNSGLAIWTSQIYRQSVRQGGSKGCDCSAIISARTASHQTSGWSKRGVSRARHRKPCGAPSPPPWERELTSKLQIQPKPATDGNHAAHRGPGQLCRSGW